MLRARAFLWIVFHLVGLCFLSVVVSVGRFIIITSSNENYLTDHFLGVREGERVPGFFQLLAKPVF